MYINRINQKLNKWNNDIDIKEQEIRDLHEMMSEDYPEIEKTMAWKYMLLLKKDIKHLKLRKKNTMLRVREG